MRDLRYMTVVAVAAAGLALAGCGSGGTSQSELNRERDKTAEQAAMVEQLQNQINALRAQLNLAPADDLSDSITDLQGQVTALQGQITAAEEAARMAAEEAARKAAEEAAAAMAATALKLYAGLEHGLGDATNVRTGAYGTGDNADDIAVVIDTAAVVNLSEDKDATVAAHRGWEGKMYSASPTGGGTYEAVVYSNVGDPTEGQKFNAQYTLNPATAGNTENQMTVWTIDGTAGSKSGQWSGSLQDNGDDGVPKVGTGTFHSTYGQDGRMVGAFGANKQ